jgi:streptogramin lyase
MRTLPLLVLIVLTALPAGASRAEATNLAGTVTDPHGRPLPGIFVSARNGESGVTRTAVTDAEGAYRMLQILPGSTTLIAHQVGFRDARLEDQVLAGSDMVFDFTVRVQQDITGQIPASTIVGLLPEGPLKHQVIRDCMSCHQFSGAFVTRRGRARTREDWVQAVTSKQKMFGPGSRYPVMSGTLDPATTADWLIEHLGGPGDPTPPITAPPLPTGDALTMQVTEINFPRSRDLPTSVSLDGKGNLLVPGMITHAIYQLDLERLRFSTLTVPVSVATPSMVRVDDSGKWWVLLGFPQKLAGYEPVSKTWNVVDLGFHPESAVPDGAGKIWMSAGFGGSPGRFAVYDPATEVLKVHEAPDKGLPPGLADTFPSGTAVDAAGIVWMTELGGNRLIRFDPASGKSKVYPLPQEDSSPRRLAVGGDGVVWIPEFTGNALTRFDPATEQFTRFPAPRGDVLPFAVAVDPRSGRVWVTEAAGDALLRFDPTTETFVEFRLPSQNAFMRDLDIDPETGAVWTSYSPNPGTNPRVVRLETR